MQVVVIFVNNNFYLKISDYVLSLCRNHLIHLGCSIPQVEKEGVVGATPFFMDSPDVLE